jgi:hypothetical protein
VRLFIVTISSLIFFVLVLAGHYDNQSALGSQKKGKGSGFDGVDVIVQNGKTQSTSELLQHAWRKHVSQSTTSALKTTKPDSDSEEEDSSQVRAQRKTTAKLRCHFVGWIILCTFIPWFLAVQKMKRPCRKGRSTFLQFGAIIGASFSVLLFLFVFF